MKTSISLILILATSVVEGAGTRGVVNREELAVEEELTNIEEGEAAVDFDETVDFDEEGEDVERDLQYISKGYSKGVPSKGIVISKGRWTYAPSASPTMVPTEKPTYGKGIFIGKGIPSGKGLIGKGFNFGGKGLAAGKGSPGYFSGGFSGGTSFSSGFGGPGKGYTGFGKGFLGKGFRRNLKYDEDNVIDEDYDEERNLQGSYFTYFTGKGYPSKGIVGKGKGVPPTHAPTEEPTPAPTPAPTAAPTDKPTFGKGIVGKGSFTIGKGFLSSNGKGFTYGGSYSYGFVYGGKGFVGKGLVGKGFFGKGGRRTTAEEENEEVEE